jgi:heme/copper-type cytochrome/quinol oxidase subunit 3
MVDIPLTDLPSPTTAVALKRARWLLTMVLVASGCWVAVNEATEKDKCKTTVGRLAVHFKLDAYYSNCQCMKHSLDFSDSCNSMYIPLLH